MKKHAAQAISIIFHPIFFAIVLPFVVLHNMTQNVLYSIKWMIVSAGFIFLTLLGFLVLRPKDFLRDLDISDRKKRPAFYGVVFVFAVVYFLIAVMRNGIFFPLSIVSLGIIIGIFLFELANRYLKVSIHVAVATAFIITFAMFHGVFAFLLTFWIPLAVLWSRIVLKKHTFREALVGMGLGATVTLLTFAIGKFLI